MKWIMRLLIIFIFLTATNGFSQEGTLVGKDESEMAQMSSNMEKEDYKEYMKFFQEVYKKMDAEYYHPITRQNFAKFVYIFNTKIYNQLQGAGKSENYIKWRSAAHLVDALKSPDDIFSKFYPPKVAKEFETTVLGKKIDLGIEGDRTDKGFLVTRLQIRADAYEKGLRENDILLTINNQDTTALTDKEIKDLLTPDEGATVALKYFDSRNQTEAMIKVTSKEYFKQFVFMIPTDIPHVYCIKIERFNRKTSEDLERFMSVVLDDKESSLIIDLRGNPGGPPLAAREISAFFLTPNNEFAYFQRKNKPKAQLFVPEIPENFQYKGDIVILVNEQSGSASELFSGILQRQKRAVLMGKNTAGQVLLKSMFYFDDDSMVALVTARGHHPDGTVFPYAGVTPDQKMGDEGIDLVQYAAQYLVEQKAKQN